MRTDELDFVLPPELIAQEPVADRAGSRLLHYHRSDESIVHRRFADLPGLLRAGDLLVFNDALVIAAKFDLRKQTGGRIEGLFLLEVSPGVWRVMLKNLGAYRGVLTFERVPEVQARVVCDVEGGEYDLEVATAEPALGLLERVGRMPLPPYIRRERGSDVRDAMDQDRYQTVYAKTPGSVAAPTAGLHFTEDLIRRLDAAGVERTSVTLHVGMGTFKPVTSEILEDHRMHTERYSLSASAAEALNRAKRERRRIVAVGTTAARVIESQAEEGFTQASGETEAFIRPGYRWKHVGGLITNFHLPRSTLIALVAAMVGLEEQRAIYQAAIAQKYRFFSYGDAMLIE